MAFGKWALPRIFDEVARSCSNELFVYQHWWWPFSDRRIYPMVGVIYGIGAFMAGMLLGESQYRRQLEADIRPFAIY